MNAYFQYNSAAAVSLLKLVWFNEDVKLSMINDLQPSSGHLEQSFQGNVLEKLATKYFKIQASNMQ